MWEWDGQRWTMVLGVPSVHGPSFPIIVDGAYDSVQHGFTLLGMGTSRAWDGGRWTQTGIGAVQSDARIVFDEARNRFIKHRPQAAGQLFEWDGTSWVSLPAGPAVRSRSAMAYDPVGQRTVLYGGQGVGGGTYGDCWSWDGTAWTQLAVAAPPGPRSGACMAFDPQSGSLILYGDVLGNTATWSLSGTTWTQIATATNPGPRWLGQMVYDGAGMLLLGGREIDQWRLVGNNWQLLAKQHQRRNLASLAFDEANQELVLFGGDLPGGGDETWTYDGAWLQHSPPVSPSERRHAALAWSTPNNATLLFGGQDSAGQPLGETWLWDGTNWTQQTTVPSPTNRAYPAMAPDPSGGLLLFGGIGLAVNQDQWHWDGLTWTQVVQPVMPGALSPVEAGYDPLRNKTLLFGLGSTQQAEMWEWDGLAWTQIPVPANIAVYPYGLCFDPATGRMLLDGSLERWEYDAAAAAGQQWTKHVVNGAVGSFWRSIASAPSLGGIFSYPMSNQYLYVQAPALALFTTSPAKAERYGSGCSLAAVPTLSARGRLGPAYPTASLHYASYLPNAVSFVAVGLSAVQVPLNSGCELLVGSQVAGFTLVTDSNGEAQLPVPVPANNSLVGFEFVAQGASLDPVNGPFVGISLSDGLLIGVGN